MNHELGLGFGFEADVSRMTRADCASGLVLSTSSTPARNLPMPYNIADENSLNFTSNGTNASTYSMKREPRGDCTGGAGPTIALLSPPPSNMFFGQQKVGEVPDLKEGLDFSPDMLYSQVPLSVNFPQLISAMNSSAQQARAMDPSANSYPFLFPQQSPPLSSNPWHIPFLERHDRPSRASDEHHSHKRSRSDRDPSKCDESSSSSVQNFNDYRDSYNRYDADMDFEFANGRERAHQIAERELVARRKTGDLCLGNFLFGCTAPRPKHNRVRPFGRCGSCLAGKKVPLQRTRMSKFSHFKGEKRKTLVPATRNSEAIRCERYPKVFGNWHLLVFQTIEGAERATHVLGLIESDPALVETTTVLPKNVWANGVPFVRSGKFNKLIPKHIDASSVVPDEEIEQQSDSSSKWNGQYSDVSNDEGSERSFDGRLDQTPSELNSRMETMGLGSLGQVSIKSHDTRICMYGLCDCKAPQCDHVFNPNLWIMPKKLHAEDRPVRWIQYGVLGVSTEGPFCVRFKTEPPMESEAFLLKSIFYKRFEFQIPIPPPTIIKPNQKIKVEVEFEDQSLSKRVKLAPFTFVFPKSKHIRVDERLQ